MPTPVAHLVGWAAVAIVNAAIITLTLPMPAVEVRLFHHVYDFAQVLAVGLLVSWACDAWLRWGPTHRAWGYLAGWGVALVVGIWMLPEDVAVLANKLARVGPAWLYLAFLVVGTATGIPAAAWVGSRFAWLPSRFLAALAAVAAMAGNHFFAPHDYPGMHFFISWGAATLLGATIAAPADPTRRDRWLRLALSVLSFWALVIPPSNEVRLELFRLSGSSVAPWAARLQPAAEERATAPVDPGLVPPEWMQNRVDHPPVPPTKAGLLPENGLVILIVVDTLRADLLRNPPSGARLKNLIELEKNSVVFTNARTTAPATTQAVSALMSGRYYSQLYWTNIPGRSPEAMYPHEDETVRFPQLLTKSGVKTIHIVGLSGLLESFGIVRGFQEETFVPGPGFAGARRMVPRAIARLRKLRQRPAFLYMQFNDPHYPYDRGGKDGSAFDRYVAEVQVVDRQVGRLIDALRKQKLYDKTVFILTSDHGEAFGEHGVTFHATALYEEMVRIPLMIRVPSVPSRKVDEPVSIIDLGPTILDLFDVDTPGSYMGQSLVPLIAGGDQELTRPLAIDSSRLMRAMVFRDGKKVMHDRRKGTVEIYDLERDPDEKTNLYDADDPESQKRLGVLKRFFEVHRLKRPGYTIPYGR